MMQSYHESHPARLLWDQGGLWSLMCLEAHEALGLPLGLVTAEQIRSGGLQGARLLIVPGGWAALKLKALGPEGAEAVRGFVAGGGFYLGFCGGAGLALKVKDGLGLVDLGRARDRRRLPNLSGPLWVGPGEPSRGHPLWRGIDAPARFHVWWPGRFHPGRPAGVEVVAAYDRPAPGLCVSDLRVDRVDPGDWPRLEAAYGIGLDPRTLAGQPAVVEARVGRGRALLSYLHLDTPGDQTGAQALANLWRAWLGVEPRPPREPAGAGDPRLEPAAGVEALWRLGQELGLWEERHPCMPLWRRGARGLEMWSLVRLTRALCQRAGGDPRGAELVSRAARALEPVLAQGPRVLEGQAARLREGGPSALAAAGAEAAWFPAPRRVGDDLKRALEALEAGLGRLAGLGG